VAPKPSGVYVERTLTFSCPSVDLCLEILQKIDEELVLEADIHAELKLSKLVFKVIGLEPSVQSAMFKLKEFLALYILQKVNPRHGIDTNTLAKYLKKTVPLDVVAVVIRKSIGVSADVRGSMIYADTDLEILLGIARKVAEAQKRVEQMQLPSNVKKLLVAAMAIYNVDHREILETLRSTKLIDENYDLKKPWSQILDELSDLLGLEEVA
jgi:hypothetical protein